MKNFFNNGKNTKGLLEFSNLDNDKGCIISSIREHLGIKESVPLSKFKSIESESMDIVVKTAKELLIKEVRKNNELVHQALRMLQNG